MNDLELDYYDFVNQPVEPERFIHHRLYLLWLNLSDRLDFCLIEQKLGYWFQATQKLKLCQLTPYARLELELKDIKINRIKRLINLIFYSGVLITLISTIRLLLITLIGVTPSFLYLTQVGIILGFIAIAAINVCLSVQIKQIKKSYKIMAFLNFYVFLTGS